MVTRARKPGVCPLLNLMSLRVSIDEVSPFTTEYLTKIPRNNNKKAQKLRINKLVQRHLFYDPLEKT